MIAETIRQIERSLNGKAKLIAVTKTKPVELLREAYNAGCRRFGENKVQEMADKQPQLPDDVQWHLIGHLQSNKVKYIAPFVALIHSVDSLKLLQEINKQAAKHNRVIDCLLQIYIADEETKFGLSPTEAELLLNAPELNDMHNIRLIGLMGLATNTDDEAQVRQEFRGLKQLFDKLAQLRHPQIQFQELSMGMSGDYHIALEEGSTMVRVGSAIFGSRS
ncbi:YggS family pyridoxal phosphate-dependent enzyme [Spirosoma sp. KCTC 42546]|uniref:YggS family pyridoxal phosphate-dependent enzyme n=1 Tax=Spirosoma sp. KCTC 42546 TaxID=2520506 RepID=UPI00115B2A34|nr:YggS family pyridoxal phosphate-dependent enzyme [Spirosoma sp. KCTC 42546]QDK79914.1 YggS family pyridoxal phosphate-dependent enzyme [Spirosoma sp. KCTC 42546]